MFTGDAAEAALEKAKTQEGEITDPYFMEVTEDGKVAGAKRCARASAPMVRPSLWSDHLMQFMPTAFLTQEITSEFGLDA